MTREQAGTGLSGFFGGISQNIAANLCGGVIGAGCVSLGLASSNDLASFSNWPSWILVAGALTVLAFGGNSVRLIRRWRRRRRIKAADGERIALLIASLDGDDDHRSKQREVVHAVKRELGAAVQVTSWPDSLAIPDGRDIDASSQIRKTAKKWLEQTQCDVLIVGHVKGDRSVHLRFLTRAGDDDGKNYGLSSDTMELPAAFGSDLAAALAAQITVEAAPALDLQDVEAKILETMRNRITPLLARPLPQDARYHITRALAGVQYKLGFRDPGLEGFQDAVSRYRELTTLIDRATEPERWASAHLNLASVLIGLASRQEGATSFDAALEALEEVSPIYLREVQPVDWAVYQNTYGVALALLAYHRPGADLLKSAANAFRLALTVRTRDAFPNEWATSASNLGNAIVDLGFREEDLSDIDEAILLLKEVLEVRARHDHPEEWAQTTSVLATAYYYHAVLSQNDVARAREAIAAYESVLEVYTRDQFPEKWAGGQLNLGNALQYVAAVTGDPGSKDRARSIYREVLDATQGGKLPRIWATTQKSLCDLLLALAPPPDLEDALVAAQAALEILTEAENPIGWATTIYALGRAHLLIGYRDQDAAQFRKAESAFAAALRVHARGVDPKSWVKVQNQMGDALLRLGEIEGRADQIERAEDAYRAALEVLDRASLPPQWAPTQSVLGFATALRAELIGDFGLAQRAVEISQPALEVADLDDGVTWAMIRFNAGFALLVRAQLGGGKKDAQAARDAFAEALPHFQTSDLEWERSRATNELHRADEIIAALQA
jgi:tetratricopeptide (TPR) repeat protein